MISDTVAHYCELAGCEGRCFYEVGSVRPDSTRLVGESRLVLWGRPRRLQHAAGAVLPERPAGRPSPHHRSRRGSSSASSARGWRARGSRLGRRSRVVGRDLSRSGQRRVRPFKFGACAADRARKRRVVWGLSFYGCRVSGFGPHRLLVAGRGPGCWACFACRPVVGRQGVPSPIWAMKFFGRHNRFT